MAGFSNFELTPHNERKTGECKTDRRHLTISPIPKSPAPIASYNRELSGCHRATCIIFYLQMSFWIISGQEDGWSGRFSRWNSDWNHGPIPDSIEIELRKSWKTRVFEADGRRKNRVHLARFPARDHRGSKSISETDSPVPTPM